ncbi:GTPase Obg-like [Condylostylus longicornis]|uniref:GTPase Obg-like n=1 Tax=Condylostylus longicornis TaxID=2530218 RepID=UPI00244DB8F3|nr:GTPase Obg-like [Condylostylus longicornis]
MSSLWRVEGKVVLAIQWSAHTFEVDLRSHDILQFRNPHTCEPGVSGERRLIYLVVKCLADVGFLGFPNAGKSTIISAVEFTYLPRLLTFQSRLRVVVQQSARNLSRQKPQTSEPSNTPIVKSEITIADLPGIIEGAHAGIGMGTRFLQHAERTKTLAFIVDMSNERFPPWDAFSLLRKEVDKYSSKLSNKPFIVIANKCDIRPNETVPKIDILWKSVIDSAPQAMVIPVNIVHVVL